MTADKREHRITIRLSDREWKTVQRRMELCHVANVSGLCRHMLLNGVYLEFDTDEFKRIQRAVASVANNVNQIATRVNATGNLYEEDIAEIKKGVDEIWHEVQSMQFILQKLSQCAIS